MSGQRYIAPSLRFAAIPLDLPAQLQVDSPLTDIAVFTITGPLFLTQVFCGKGNALNQAWVDY